MIDYIRVQINSSPDAWGSECTSDMASAAAEILTDMIERRLQEDYPEAEISVVVGDSGETYVHASLDETDYTIAQNAQRGIDDAISDIWTNALIIAALRSKRLTVGHINTVLSGRHQILRDAGYYVIAERGDGQWQVTRERETGISDGYGYGRTPEDALVGAYQDGGRPERHRTLALAVAEIESIYGA